MMSVEDARAVMLRETQPTRTQSISLETALGRRLAVDAAARIDQPPFDASAMDGWAVRCADTPGDLRIIGESAAGAPFEGTLAPGETVRISTGAALPANADSVVMQEDAERDGDMLRAPAARPAHIRERGLDFSTDDILLASGRRIDGHAMALLAAAGCDPVTVHAPPRVAVIATGDELVAPSDAAGAGQIYDSVSFGLSGLIKSWGGAPHRAGRLGDDLMQTSEATKYACTKFDLVMTVGGASVGDHDVVKPAVQAMGGEVLVYKISVKPGKPTWFASCPGANVLGLPGNPASALVCAHLFLKPILDVMQGKAAGEASPRLCAGVLDTELPANGARESYLRARAAPDAQGRFIVSPIPRDDSSLLTPLARANALIRRPADAPARTAGDGVEVLVLNEWN